MANDPSKITEILQRAEAVLATARQGLGDVLDKGRNRRISGLHNVIVFGRTVSFVLQNLKSVTDGFEEWYAAEQEAMKADPVMRFMVEARNEILKQGKLNVTTSTHIQSFSGKDAGPPPFGAVAYFIGDALGGSGWEIQIPGGGIEKYYVDLPKGVSVTQHFADLPTDKFPELKGLSVDQIVDKYVDDMEALVLRARKRFFPTQGGRPSHLRLVKG